MMSHRITRRKSPSFQASSCALSVKPRSFGPILEELLAAVEGRGLGETTVRLFAQKQQRLLKRLAYMLL